MKELTQINWRDTVSRGLLAGFISLNLAAIGMVQLFGERYLLAGILTMGQVLIFGAPVLFAYAFAKSFPADKKLGRLVAAAVIGAVNALILIVFIWLAQTFDLRSILANVSPVLIELLTFGLGMLQGSLLLLAASIGAAILSALLTFLPELYKRAVITAIGVTALVGMLSPILVERIRNFFGQQSVGLIFSSNALQLWAGLIVFITTLGIVIAWRLVPRPSAPKLNSKLNNKLIKQVPLSIVLLFLPLVLGTYLTEVANNVGIFLLMGLGLNIVVGLAGLLDLGYVAFFAIGAYTMAVLTSTGPLGIAETSFWVALPVCVAVAAFAGLILGIPVLRMRGDYLAIVTLGFGEIIRILALSDMLKPYIGGAQGVLSIPKPSIGPVTLVTPEYLYYVILGAALLAAFISNRLRASRVGRSWIAMREDEDVAQAMGIGLVRIKLLAFAVGAGFSGLAGAIFASKLTSIFPHSFSLLISINVLSLIIVGGLGSIPGTIVGAIVLVGLPELLREFAEFRWLIYGMLLVIMMLNRPEGFIPSDIIRRELHAVDAENSPPA